MERSPTRLARSAYAQRATRAMTIEDVLARHKLFWKRADVDRPLVSYSRWPYASITDFDWGLPQEEGVLLPEMLQVDHFLPQYEALFNAGGPFDGDMLWTATAPRAVPWLEATLGCPIRYSLHNGAMFAEPTTTDWTSLPAPDLEASAWFRKLREFATAIANLADGRFPVAMPLLRGPWDLVAALGGMTRLYLDLYDNPTALAQIAGRIAEIWVESARQLADVIPTWHGGQVGHYGLWAPGLALTTQNDCSVSVSPDIYTNLMLPADRLAARASPFEMFHLHSAGLHLLEPVLDTIGDRALNVTVDPSGPALDRLIPILARAQARGVRLHVLVFERDHVARLSQTLSPIGLAILCWPRE
jgi:hypothetical protein